MKIEGQLLALIFVSLMLGYMLPAIVVVPGAPNPLNDLTSAMQVTIPGTTSEAGTTNQQNATQIQHQQAQNVGCGGSVVAGAVGGAIVGTIVPGIGTLIGAGAGALIGGLTGCAVLPAVAPNVIQSFGNTIQGVANSAGIGGIVTEIGAVIGIVNALLKFLPDLLAYEAALFSIDPVIGSILFPITGYTIVLTGLYFIRILRGSEG